MWTGFQRLVNGSRVLLQLNRRVAYGVRRQSRILRLTLRGCRLHSRLRRRPLVTRFFQTPVVSVRAVQRGGDVQVHLRFRHKGHVRFRRQRSARRHFVILEFPDAGAGALRARSTLRRPALLPRVDPRRRTVSRPGPPLGPLAPVRACPVPLPKPATPWIDHFKYNGVARRAFYHRYEFLCSDGPCWYDGAGLMTYPTAWYPVSGYWRLLRIGIGLAGAGEHQEQVDSWVRHQWGMELLLSAGLQVPLRVTPYVELQTSIGFMHLYLYNRDAFSFAYSLSVLAGAEWFIVARMTVGVALGWRRTISRFEGAALYADSFTLQVSFGL